MRSRQPLFVCIVAGGFALTGLTPQVRANQPPTAQQIEQYRADGTLAQRVLWARELGNHLVDPHLAARTARRLGRLAGAAEGPLAPPPAWVGLPTTGAPQVFVLLVDFPDFPHSATQTVADVESKFFGSGIPRQYPLESLRSFYLRSSYGQLDIQGTVFDWYTAQHARSYYEGLGIGAGQEAVTMEALAFADAQGHDFSRYDNNGDGVIEAFFVEWTGPDNGWSNFWWPYLRKWRANPGYTLDGMRLASYVWSWIASPEGEPYRPAVDIHETGHALGLPDLYDYDAAVGPNGGVGGLDMMGGFGDHGCFSKFMLGWVAPTVVASGTSTLQLGPSGTAPDCVLLMPQAAAGEVFHEYFLAQYRRIGNGNDPAYFPGSGLVIWHVDATLTADGSTFAFDNAFTPHKLLRLMEADGLEEIETGDGQADAGDFYLPPAAFGPMTTPSSHDYHGVDSRVVIDQLSPPGASAAARFAIATAASIGSLDPPAAEAMRFSTWLAGAQPNPFNPRTRIVFTLARAQHVRLSIFDAAGRLVVVLASGQFEAGEHAVPWDGRDAAGVESRSGTYFVQLRADRTLRTAKLLLAR